MGAEAAANSNHFTPPFSMTSSENSPASISARREDVLALPRLGLGLGLRHVHFDYIVEHWPELDWFEAISENFMDSGGRNRHLIRQVAERYPVVLHGVSLSIGSTDPLDFNYLEKLKNLAAEVQPQWVSDHLCWTGIMGVNTHDLLPVPLTEETLKHISKRVLRVQDFLERPLILENPSTYLEFSDSSMEEPDFLRALSEETGCGLLLDVNNTYVTCFNAEKDPISYIKNFPCEHVVQMHLAGHEHCGTHIIDTHDQPVLPAVWELYRLAWQRTQGASTLLEWDGNIPSFEECHRELLKAKQYMQGAFRAEAVTTEGSGSASNISNPVDFLVPGVMQNTVLENS